MTNAITSPANKPMCQRMSNETMCKTLITMVYDGVPTEELLRASGRSKNTIYRLFREHYATPNCAAHKKLLKKLRENDAKMAEAQRLKQRFLRGQLGFCGGVILLCHCLLPPLRLRPAVRPMPRILRREPAAQSSAPAPFSFLPWSGSRGSGRDRLRGPAFCRPDQC